MQEIVTLPQHIKGIALRVEPVYKGSAASASTTSGYWPPLLQPPPLQKIAQHLASRALRADFLDLDIEITRHAHVSDICATTAATILVFGLQISRPEPCGYLNKNAKETNEPATEIKG